MSSIATPSPVTATPFAVRRKPLTYVTPREARLTADAAVAGVIFTAAR